MAKRTAKKASKSAVVVRNQCRAPRCPLPGIRYRRHNWWCKHHIPPEPPLPDSCGHSHAITVDGDVICSWCSNLIAQAWPRREL